MSLLRRKFPWSLSNYDRFRILESGWQDDFEL
jgi:hypothetical protein